jgi:hypothetical protein
MLENQIKIGKKLFTVNSKYVNWLKKYKQNKKTNVGSNVNCVVCSKEMIKKRESYVFCGLQCKDDFWNKIDPRKRNSKRVSAVNRRRNEWLKGSDNTSTNEDWCTQGDDMEACGYHNKD